MKINVFVISLFVAVFFAGCKNSKISASETARERKANEIENPLEDTTWRVVEGVLFDGVINSGEVHEEFEGEILSFRDGGIYWRGTFYKISGIQQDEEWSEEELYDETHGSQSMGYTFDMLRFSGEKIRTISFEFEDKNESRPLGYFVYFNSDKNIWAMYNTIEYWCEKVY